MKKNLVLLHILLLFLTIAGVTAVMIRGVLVNQTYGRLPLSAFFKLETYTKLPSPAAPSVELPIYFIFQDRVVDQKGMSVYELPSDATQVQYHKNENLLGYVAASKYQLVDLSEQQLRFDTAIASNATVLGLTDTQLLIAQPTPDDTWQTNAVQLSEPSTVQFVLESPAKPILADGVLSYLDCTNFCEVVILNETFTEVHRLPAFTDASFNPTLLTTQLYFVDPSAQLFAYQASQENIYVATFELEFLQDIRTENERNVVEFIGYYPSTKQLLFTLNERSGEYKQLALYAADKPSLHLLEKIPADMPVSILANSPAMLVGDTLYNLQGEVVSSVPEGTVISGQ